MNNWILILMIVGGLLSVMAIATGVLFYRHPLAVNTYFERLALKRAGGLRARFISLSTGKLMLWAGGDGPAVLLLHGAGDQAGTWSKVVPKLVRNYRVLIPDLPGHGASEPETGPLDVEMIFRAVKELLALVLPDEPVTIVGNSLGAWVATLMAAREPEQVARLVLVNGGAVRGTYKGPGLLPRDLDGARAVMAILLGKKGEHLPEFVLKDFVRQAQGGPISRLMADPSKMGASLMDGGLRNIHCPVRLLWGELDRMFDLDYATAMMAKFPDVRLTTLENCGHVPQRHCPEKFAEALLKILKEGVEPGGGTQ